MRIWIVEATSGMYSDAEERPICWFRTEEAAKLYAAECQEDVSEINPDDWHGVSEPEKFKARFRHDKNCWRDDTEYRVYPLDEGRP